MSGTKGAATAAPTLTELAEGIRVDLAGIEGDNRAALEKAIAAGEKLNRAKAQMGHGEWLPWLKENFELSGRTARDYMRLANWQHAANFNSIREALASLPKKPRKEPARSDEQLDYNNKHWENDDVIAWVARRMKAGKTRDEIVAESQEGAYEWPLPNRWLGKNAADICRGIVRDRKRRGDNNRRREPKEAGKRLRQLHAEKRAGRGLTDLWYMQKTVTELVGVLEGFDLPELDWSEETEELTNEIYEDLGRGARWVDTALDVVAAHMDGLGRQRKIRKLRARIDDPSSTPSERMTAARQAEKLEHKRSLTV
jgi:hypothetical protein